MKPARIALALPTLAALCALPVLSSTAASTLDLPEKVTWAGEVAEVVYQNCAGCHRPGDIAPMSLLSYEEARPWAKSMLRAIKGGLMPPWHADPKYGHFANDRRLSEREAALIERWVRQGARAGDLDEAPSPPSLDEGWRLGEPDLVVTLDPVSLPAGGPDVFEDVLADVDLDEERWLRAVEVKPGDRRVVHHVILASTDGQTMPSSGWLGAWAAGIDPMVFPEGTAKLIEPGKKILADMHYHPTTEPVTDQTQIGLYFYDGEPEKELINLWIQNQSFTIPAGAKDHVVEASFTFGEDSTIYGLLPHMHYRGKEFTYTATYPDGRQEVLLHVPDYDFNWQTLYQVEEPLSVPKGTRIDCVAHFDNSRKNPDNPDPNRDVTFGPESFDEMMIGFVDYVVDQRQRPLTAEEQVAQLLAELSRQHPGEVWAVTVHDRDDGIKVPTALYLPRAGEGTWHIGMMGQLMEGTLKEIAFDGDSYTAVLVAPFGTLRVNGEIVGESVSGSVAMGDESLSFEGTAHRE